MRYAIVFMLFAAVAACGVDGPPIRPEKDSARAPGRHAPAKPEPGRWIGGTASMHTAATL